MASKINSISKEEQKWRAESDLDALKRAKEIMADKVRFSAAQAVGKKQMMALGGIVGVTKTPVKKKK
jgi:hypothetical protein